MKWTFDTPVIYPGDDELPVTPFLSDPLDPSPLVESLSSPSFLALSPSDVDLSSPVLALLPSDVDLSPSDVDLLPSVLALSPVLLSASVLALFPSPSILIWSFDISPSLVRSEVFVGTPSIFYLVVPLFATSSFDYEPLSPPSEDSLITVGVAGGVVGVLETVGAVVTGAGVTAGAVVTGAGVTAGAVVTGAGVTAGAVVTGAGVTTGGVVVVTGAGLDGVVVVEGVLPTVSPPMTGEFMVGNPASFVELNALVEVVIMVFYDNLFNFLTGTPPSPPSSSSSSSSSASVCIIEIFCFLKVFFLTYKTSFT